MAKKNGHDDSEESNIAQFPDARERREIERRYRVANDRKPPSEPIFNLPPGVKYLAFALLLVQVFVQLAEWAPKDWGLDPVLDWGLENLAFFMPRYTGAMPFGWQGAVSPVTYMFLHGGWIHLLANLLSLAAFGTGFERFMGMRRMLFIFFVTGIIAAFSQLAVFIAATMLGYQFPLADAPLIGASGGICGVMGATLRMLQERDMLGGNGKLGIMLFVGSFFIFAAFGMPGVTQPISGVAHIGGFLAGLALYRPIARSKIFN